MDRLARYLDNLRHIVQSWAQRGVRIEITRESLTFTGEDSPMTNLMLSVMGALAEFERARIRERQCDGLRSRDSAVRIAAVGRCWPTRRSGNGSHGFARRKLIATLGANATGFPI
jgi:DNA invertase Pin-like site-specific DNA recombinase